MCLLCLSTAKPGQVVVKNVFQNEILPKKGFVPLSNDIYLLSPPLGFLLTIINRIKRESGANPELSRSCKKLHVSDTIYATSHCTPKAGWEGHKLSFKPEYLPWQFSLISFRGERLRNK
jgi:hypothetical protein